MLLLLLKDELLVEKQQASQVGNVVGVVLLLLRDQLSWSQQSVRQVSIVLHVGILS